MAAPGIHLVPHHDEETGELKWEIKVAFLYDTKDTAEASARQVSRVLNAELHIHDQRGVIREKDSSGHAPDPPDIPG